jgi:hypothetical protein
MRERWNVGTGDLLAQRAMDWVQPVGDLTPAQHGIDGTVTRARSQSRMGTIAVVNAVDLSRHAHINSRLISMTQNVLSTRLLG